MKALWIATLLFCGTAALEVCAAQDGNETPNETPGAQDEGKQDQGKQRKERPKVQMPDKPMRKHPSCHLYLDLPKDFLIATDWRGYYKDLTESSILLHESDRPLDVVKKSFFDDARLRKIDRKITKREDRKINGYDGYYVEIVGQLEQREYKIFSVVFGDSKGSCIVSGQYFPAIAEELDAAIVKNAVETVWWDRPPMIDPFDHVGFTIDERAIGALRYIAKDENLVKYSFGKGIDTTKNPGRPLLLIEQRKGKVEEKDREARLRKGLDAVPDLRDYKVDETFEAIEIDGLKGYRGYGYGISELHKDMYGNDMPVTVCHVMLFDDENHYFMSGVIATKIGRNWLKMFQAGMESFQLKREGETKEEHDKRRQAERLQPKVRKEWIGDERKARDAEQKGKPEKTGDPEKKKGEGDSDA